MQTQTETDCRPEGDAPKPKRGAESRLPLPLPDRSNLPMAVWHLWTLCLFWVAPRHWRPQWSLCAVRHFPGIPATQHNSLTLHKPDVIICILLAVNPRERQPPRGLVHLCTRCARKDQFQKNRPDEYNTGDSAHLSVRATTEWRPMFHIWHNTRKLTPPTIVLYVQHSICQWFLSTAT